MDRRTTIAASLTLALVIALSSSSLVLAKGPGGGGGGGGGETTLTNNLSVPAIMIGGGFTGVTCGTPDAPSALVAPTGTPLTGYTVNPTAYYFVQGVHKWQAQCYTDTAATATADWGDNLVGDAKLKVASPIRVELGMEAAGSMTGFEVIKLEPEKLDRESAYGTLATAVEGGGYAATPFAFTLVRVYDAGMTFSIQNVATGAYVVQPGTKATAEINATGRVVYGYNLRVTQAGQYLITYVTKAVTLTNADPGDLTGTTISLVINVVAGGGGRR